MKNTAITIAAFAFLTGANAFAGSPDTLLTIENIVAMNRPIQTGQDPGACDMDAARSACTNSTDSYSFNGCSIGKGRAVMVGSWDEAFTGNGADTCTNPLIDGESVTRTSKGLTLNFPSGESLLADTAAGTAYDGTAIPEGGIVAAFANGVTTVTLTGSHTVLKLKEGNVAEENFAISTSPFLITGAQDDGSLVLSEGAARIFHQQGKYTSDVSVEKLAWSDKTCCHPVSGHVTEVMSGSKTGTRSLTFTAKCGVATRVDVDGSSSDVTLPACN